MGQVREVDMRAEAVGDHSKADHFSSVVYL